MKHRVFLFRVAALWAAVFLLSGGAGAGEVFPPPYLETTGRLTTYPQAMRLIESLPAGDPSIRVETLGVTSGGRLPVYAVRLWGGDKGGAEKLRVMIIGRIHGDEPAGMEALLKFLADWRQGRQKSRKKYLDNLDIYVIPCLNPEGAEKAMADYRKSGGFWDKTGRDNVQGQGVDINRDFHALRSSEARWAVGLFNRIKPHAVLDLHEYSSVPIVVAGSGWWRARYFDFLVGAGRHPDVYPPLSRLARRIAEEAVFPRMRKMGFKGEYYALSGGSFDSTPNMGVTAADYFNLRNALTFLVETAGYDQGGRTVFKRRDNHVRILGILLDELAAGRQEIAALVEDSREFAKKRQGITLQMQRKPRLVEIDGRKTASFTDEAFITIDGKSYRSEVRVRFEEGDPLRREMAALPPCYVLLTQSRDLLEKLIFHEIEVFQARSPIETPGFRILPGCFVVPAAQENSAIAGLLLDERAYYRNRYSPKERCLVLPCQGPVDVRLLTPIKTDGDILEGLRLLQQCLTGQEGVE